MKKLTSDQKKQISILLQEYFLRERSEALGELASHLLAGFIEEEIGPIFYNQAVEDAQKYMSERVEDLIDLQKY